MWGSDQCGDFAGHGFSFRFLVVPSMISGHWNGEGKDSDQLGCLLDSFQWVRTQVGCPLSWRHCGSSLYCNILSQGRDGWCMLLEWFSLQGTWPLPSLSPWGLSLQRCESSGPDSLGLNPHLHFRVHRGRSSFVNLSVLLDSLASFVGEINGGEGECSSKRESEACLGSSWLGDRFALNHRALNGIREGHTVS